MPRRRQDVDWYCEMSEWLERKERRRKWIWLAVFVSIPLLLMGTFVVFVELKRRGVQLPQAVKNLLGSTPTKDEPAPIKLEYFDPVVVEKIVEQSVRFTQLDANGLPTTITYFFREVPLDLGEDQGVSRKGFVILPSKEDEGVVQKYHLVNAATGESFEFANVEAKLVSEDVGWQITDPGWTKIRDELRARMQVQLSRPIFN